ncbi:basic leucine zipper 2 [Mangifera indica]|uniref:basic leucine zipper 2 n=1 Tax=Mangifera indica TaxID=29780 RepID=UPI001CFABEED|nr:basic leucine zipper 2 [Mangifera indica]XP_044462382.1 basic leucine zipper 2 [Mangifera indica]XP_044462383.1 basic leucine zipper 2 [Mangifera indica]
MSRQAHLPPRCPFQKKPVSRPFRDPISPLQRTESYPSDHKSSFQSSILEDQPTWLDDLLSNPGTNSVGIIHRRSSSDSFTLLDGLVDSFSGLNPGKDDDNSVGDETCSGLESACVYGPNSPRKKGNSTFSESAIVSALSECVVENPLQYVDESLCISGINHSDFKGDACTLTSELNAETKMAKRHSGQRSRVRKLQYIAELERTVSVFQTIQSELSVRVASLLQQHVSLSLENRTLKQQVARLQQEKMIMEGQYKSLKKEAERLKIGLAKSSPSSKAKAFFGSQSAAEASRPEVTWQMLDMTNLNLN